MGHQGTQLISAREIQGDTYHNTRQAKFRMNEVWHESLFHFTELEWAPQTGEFSHRVSTGRSADFMFKTAASNSTGGT